MRDEGRPTGHLGHHSLSPTQRKVDLQIRSEKTARAATTSCAVRRGFCRANSPGLAPVAQREWEASAAALPRHRPASGHASGLAHSSKVRTSPDALHTHPPQTSVALTQPFWAAKSAAAFRVVASRRARAAFCDVGTRASDRRGGGCYPLPRRLPRHRAGEPPSVPRHRPTLLPGTCPKTLTGSRRARGRATRNPRLGDSLPSARARTRRTRSSATWTCRSAGPSPSPRLIALAASRVVDVAPVPAIRRSARSCSQYKAPKELWGQTANPFAFVAVRASPLSPRPFEPPDSLPSPSSDGPPAPPRRRRAAGSTIARARRPAPATWPRVTTAPARSPPARTARARTARASTPRARTAPGRRARATTAPRAFGASAT